MLYRRLGLSVTKLPPPISPLARTITMHYILLCTQPRAPHHVVRLLRSGVAAASATVSQRLGKSGRSDGEKTPAYPEIDPTGSITIEAKVQPARTGSVKRVLEEDVEAWMESLGTPQKYVDYAAVAKERVSAARRTRGSDLARGPACPVCSG